jgi:hypothetical protein
MYSECDQKPTLLGGKNGQPARQEAKTKNTGNIKLDTAAQKTEKRDEEDENQCHHVNECCSGLGSSLGALRIVANTESNCAASTPPCSCQNVECDDCCMANS